MRSSVLRSRFVTQVAVLSGGTALAQVISVLIYPVLTRLFTPDQMGVFGLFSSFVAFAVTGASLRYEVAIVSADDDVDAFALVVLSVFLAAVSAALAPALLIGLHRSSVLGFGLVPPSAAAIAGFAVLVGGVLAALRYWQLRTERYKVISESTLMQAGARAITQSAGGLLGVGWPALALGDVIGQLAGVGRMLRDVRAFRRQATTWSAPSLLRVMRRYWRFPVFSLPSSLIDTLAMTIPLPLLAGRFGPEAAGLYALAHRIMALPTSLIVGSTADAFHSRIAVEARERPQNVRRLFFTVAGGLALLGVLPMGLLYVGAGSIFGWAFGADWAAAGRIVSLLVPWFYAQLIVGPLSRIVFVAEAQQVKFVYDVVSLATVIVVIHGAAGRGFTLNQTVLWLSAAQAGVYALYFILLARAAHRTGRVDAAWQE